MVNQWWLLISADLCGIDDRRDCAYESFLLLASQVVDDNRTGGRFRDDRVEGEVAHTLHVGECVRCG